MNPPPLIKFLLVDDLEANLLALEGLLKRDGLQLLKARSGPEALELLLIHEVALAFLDVQMPGMGGFELAEMMRSTERTRSVPIIFLTAGVVDQQRRIRGYETGAVDFLAKPIEAHSLLNKSAVFFELARQRESLRQSETRLRKANDDLARADQAKDEFLAMLAHELRNPLAPLRNATELLKSSDTTTEERCQAEQIMDRQIENMSRMIDDLLDVSRITEGKIELRKHPVLLETILSAAAATVGSLCSANGQQLTVTLPKEPVWLDADATRLEQVFGNLLTNASKYAGKDRRIWLTAEVTDFPMHRRENGAARAVIVRVRDDGTGIAPELLPRIFDLFVQASRTLDRQHGGLGIGLTLAQRLVRLHGGTIEAHSEGIGKGAEFTTRLPILSEAPQVMPRVPPQSKEQETPRKILIVDDRSDSAQTLSVLLSRRGHVTRMAFTGPDAVVAATEFIPEIILLDIGLPGMNGFEVARKVRSIPALEGVLLIAISGYGRDEDIAEARAAGFDEYLIKPMNLTELREIIAGFCPAV